MIGKIYKTFNVKFSSDGKKMIRKWLSEEFGTTYYAKKSLETDEDIINFINDMLETEKMTFDDLIVKEVKKKTSVKKSIKKKIKYCPYCGERLE